jgi:hypothetical protein
MARHSTRTSTATNTSRPQAVVSWKSTISVDPRAATTAKRITQLERLLLITASGLVVTGCSTSATPAPPRDSVVRPEILSIDSATASAPMVEMTCSETKLRTPVAVIRFTARKVALDSARLDVAIQKNGFATNRFATLSLRPRNKISSLQVNPRLRDLAPAAFNFESVSVTNKADTVQVRVERLEPGVNYFWRVVENDGRNYLLSRPTRAQAVACPADEHSR